MAAGTSTTKLSVAVIADSRETIDGLHGYLHSAGVAAHSARTLRELPTIAASATAIIIFPDDFDSKEVGNRLSSLRATRPKLLLVVITGMPQRLRAVLEPDGQSLVPVVLAKPAFGWAILDVIREHADGGST